jgi:DNA-binding LytR/AlgR family response regulator
MSPVALVVEDEPLPRAQLMELLKTLWPEVTLISAKDGIEGLQRLTADRPNVAFIDIRLPGLDGIELARVAGGNCHVVFVTAHDDRALAAFEQGAVDYVLKPVTASRLALTVSRLKQRLAQPPEDLPRILMALSTPQTARLRWLQVGSATRQRLITVGDVLYFQSDSKYTRVVLKEGEELIRTSVTELLAQLDPEEFWQIHRGTIVNLQRIDSVVRKMPGRMYLELSGRSDSLAVSQAFQSRFKLM